jgi:hypothetical protein
MTPEIRRMGRFAPQLLASIAAVCFAAAAAAEPAASAPSLADLGLAPAGSGFFAAAGPDLAKGLALNGALNVSADRVLQGGSFDRGSQLALGTSSAFTIAPIVRSHYGWAAGASAYALALAAGAYTYKTQGASSSVLVGSALGMAVGETVAHRSSHARAFKDHVLMGRKGLGLKVKF